MLMSLAVGIAAQPLLNNALEDDELDDGCVSTIFQKFSSSLLTLYRFSPYLSTVTLKISPRYLSDNVQ